MKQQSCLLCGREYSTGLNVMGCLICFPCERRLLGAGSQGRLAPSERRRLARLFTRDVEYVRRMDSTSSPS